MITNNTDFGPILSANVAQKKIADNYTKGRRKPAKANIPSVSVNSQKHIITGMYGTERVAKLYDKASAAFVATVLASNHVAIVQIEKASVAVSKTDKYKFGVKRDVKDTLRLIKAYERKVEKEMRNNRFGDRWQFFLDYLRENYDCLRKDIEKFRFSIDNYLNKLHLSEVSVKTDVFLAYVMVEYVTVLFDMYWNQQEEHTGIDFRKDFEYAKLNSIRDKWLRVVKVYDPKNEVNLDNDRNCVTGFEILQTKMTGADIINKAGEVALEFNEDVKKWAEERYGDD